MLDHTIPPGNVPQDVKEYRQTIPHCVTDRDTVLEIGCSCGKTSALLYKHAKYVVAIDKGQAILIAERPHPHIHFEQIAGFDTRRMLELGYDFDKVYIDISGCRGIYDVIEKANVLQTAPQP
jgi:hypothetical protein